jgi:hypothetical protein
MTMYVHDDDIFYDDDDESVNDLCAYIRVVHFMEESCIHMWNM